jgi:hypothetical protein
MEIEWDWEQTIFKIWVLRKNSCFLRSFVNVWTKTLQKYNQIVSSTTCQESWGENEQKKWMWNVLLTKTLKMTTDFSHFFLLLCSSSSWEPNFCIKMYFFINANLIYVDLLYPTELKDSLFAVFKLLVCFHTKWEKFRFLVAGSSVHGFLRFLVCDI